MYQIKIPKNQYAKPGEAIKVIFYAATTDVLIHNGEVEIINNTDSETSTASYDVIYWADEFDPYNHGFRGINAGLTMLANMLTGK